MKILLQRKSDGKYWGYGRWVSDKILAVGFMNGFLATELAIRQDVIASDIVLHYCFPNEKYDFKLDELGPVRT